jgi:hypothetical protein
LVLNCRGLGDAADRTLQPRAYRGRKRKPIALEGAIVGTACGTIVLADSVFLRYDPEDFGLSAPPEAKGADGRRNCPDQLFCCWWCPVTAADRVIRWTATVAVIGVAAVAAVVSHEHAHAAATVKMSGHVEP